MVDKPERHLTGLDGGRDPDDDRRNFKVTDEELSAEEIRRRAMRLIGGADDAQADLGGGDPRSDLLKRKKLQLAQDLLKLKDVNLLQLNPMLSALKDVYALADSPNLTMPEYVKGELNPKIRVPGRPAPSKKEIAGYSIKGLNQLINAFSRVRTSPVTGERDTWSVADFKKDNKSPIWDDQEEEAAMLSAVDHSFELLKILYGREVSIVVAGDLEARRDTDKEDLRIVEAWLRQLKAEFQKQAHITRQSAAKTAIKSALKSTRPPR